MTDISIVGGGKNNKGWIEVKVFDSNHTLYYKNKIHSDNVVDMKQLVSDLAHFGILLPVVPKENIPVSKSKKWW